VLDVVGASRTSAGRGNGVKSNAFCFAPGVPGPLTARMAGVRLASQPLQRRCRASLLAFASALCFGASAAQGVFTVNQPWVKPGVRSTEAYMVLTSSEAASLLGVRSSVAGEARLRGPESTAVPALPLPAGRSVSLRPGGARITLERLVRPLKLRDRVALTLIVETGDGVRREIPVDAEVRNDSPVEAELRAHHR